MCKWIGFFLALLTATSLHAEDKPLCPKEISFGLYENGYIYDSKTDTGIDKDVVLELSRRTGCRFKMSLMARARIWRDLETGDLMTTGSGIRNPERDKFAWFILYMGQKNYAIVRKNIKATSASEFLADNSLNWGVIRSYKHGQDADAFLEKLGKQRIHEGVNLENEYKMLKTGRISAMFSPAPVAEKYIKELDLTSEVRIEDWFPADPNIPHGFIFSKKYFTEEELQKWRVVFNGMLRDGSLKKIYTKYIAETSANRLLQYKPE